MSLTEEDVTFGVELEYIWIRQYTSELLEGLAPGCQQWALAFLRLSDAFMQTLANGLSKLPGITCYETNPENTGTYTDWKLESDCSITLGNARGAGEDGLLSSMLAETPDPKNTKNQPCMYTLVSEEEKGVCKTQHYPHGVLDGTKYLRQTGNGLPIDILLYPSNIPNTGVRVQGRELVSRVFRAPEMPEFKANMRDILTEFNKSAVQRVTTNSSCGLHVHVGIPTHDTLKSAHCLPVFRRTAVLAIICENAMAEIVDRPGSNYCKRYSDTLGPANLGSVDSVCRYVMAAKNLEQLQNVLGCAPWRDNPRALINIPQPGGAPYDRYMRISFSPMFNPFAEPGGRVRLGKFQDYPSGDKGTVEFRAHMGTTDLNRILNWVTVCVAMMKFCVSRSDSELKRELKALGGRSMGAEAFLRGVVRDDAVSAFYADDANRSVAPPEQGEK